ncbi:hypothetical protein KCX83_14090 [Brucella oryzae]|uniref:transcriptional regulator domain-containing protein n=1 Tax=Brucella oryzae TaxID=335286 RepID=UPI00086F6A5C|nr:DUF6499 domain-containing protein [Brucella oryzae]MBR7653450.1 hypothetical protein [Brucella oryzae]ODT78117.1 MAG: hypothetical protein ABS76_25225 [Pelagibacterium sp. SCN 64-44]
MVPDTREWRTSALYDFMDEVDTDSLAWECLRRNEKYQSDFSETLGNDEPNTEQADLIRRRWGLRFPGKAQPQRHRAKRLLDA